METLSHIAYAALSLLVFSGLWILTGFVARFVVWLFCIGYGCA